MKRHLTMRIVTALTFATLAAAVAGCGNSNNNGLPIGGLNGGASIAPNINGLNGGCVINFSGIGVADQYGGISASQLSVQAMSGQASGGSFTYGRIGTDGTILEFNFTPSYFGGYGGGSGTISGVLSISPTQAATLGYGGYGYGGCPPVSSLALNSLAYQSEMQAASVVGQQPYQYILYSGSVLLNGSTPVYPY